MKIKFFLIAFLVLLVSCGEKTTMIDLSGTWQVSLESPDAEPQPIVLPGTTDLAGLGVADTLQPLLQKPQMLRLTRRHSFVGPAYYSRTFEVPSSMANRPLELTFERILWKSEVWIDGQPLAAQSNSDLSLVTPHIYTLAQGLTAGEHQIRVCVDNRKQYDISVDELCHSYTDATQVKWNGILGRMELRALPDISIDRIEVYPDASLTRLQAVIHVTNYTSQIQPVSFNLIASLPDVRFEDMWMTNPITEELVPGTTTLVLEQNIPNWAPRWSEFNPQRLLLTACGKSKSDFIQKTVSFGLRNLESKEGRLWLNDKPIFLRGTLDCCIFPLTGCPPTDREGWEQVFCNAKEWGLNHLRFHSWCPPDAAFEVADSLGFYLGVELPIWSTTLGNDTTIYDFLRQEYENVIRQYGNHPSFCLLSCGNELQYDFDFLNRFVADMKHRDPRHLYTTTSFTFEKGHGGHPEPEDQYFVTQWTDSGWVRGQGVFDAEPPAFDKNYNASMTGVDVPLITHEIGQYSVYPDMKEIPAYTGTLDPLNFKAIQADLKKKGLLDKAEDWLQASGKLAALLYKEEIERDLKTSGISGYQLLGLQDFPGQGTALVGLVNAFWQSKHVVESEWFRQFCAPVVPLANFSQAVYRTTDTLSVDLQIANYGECELEGQTLVWQLLDSESHALQQGKIALQTLAMGDVHSVGSLHLQLTDIEKAQQLTLQLVIEQTNWRNEWHIWAYPAVDVRPTDELLVTNSETEAVQALEAGETVLLSPALGTLQGLEGKFLPVFWSPVHFPKQAGTMGILCRAEHPALLHFPTQNYGDWQWWRLAKRSTVLDVDTLVGALEPIVESVDNFMRNRRLCTVFETKVGEGRLLFSAIDLLSSGAESPELQQMLFSLEQYAQSPEFQPRTSMSVEQLRGLFLSPGKDAKKRYSATSIYE